MSQLLWSIVLIAKNEAKTLPRLLSSLTEFQSRGGEIILLDTGSTDTTADTARNLGCKVFEVGTKYLTVINDDLATQINKRFVVDNEPQVIKAGDRLFDYAKARNFAASLASNDMVSMPDCDEVFSKLDLDTINQSIQNGIEQFEYNFVFAHDELGRESVKFLHSKFYNRTKMRWVGIVHEVLSGSAQRQFLDEQFIKLEHYQNVETNRSNYLTGLALDCYLNPNNDRNSHYFGRELITYKRFKSGIKELTRHVNMNRWPAEAAQSMIYIGDGYGNLNEPTKQVAAYSKAFHMDSTRRESLIRLAHFYQHNNCPKATAAYAAAALEIPWEPFYANNVVHYREEPHTLMYWAKGWMGDINSAKEHVKKVLQYNPCHDQTLRDIRYYWNLPLVSIVIPTLGREDKLASLLATIPAAANYPLDKIEIIVKQDQFPPNNIGVPKLVAQGVSESKGELVMYLGNDCVPQPNFLIQAVWAMMKQYPNLDGLIGLNDLQWNGEIATHWLASKKLLPMLDGEFFHTGYHHCGCDNELTERCRKAGKYSWAKLAVIKHNHFSLHNTPMDEVYQLAWKKEIVEQDRKLLQSRAKDLQFNIV